MHPRTKRPLSLGLAAVLLCDALAGCATPEVRFVGDVATPAPEVPYRIQPGDELEIRFFHTPVNDVVLPVRPDGYISLPLAHELKAAGRTAEELRLEIVQRYSGELVEPELAVILRKYNPYLVHVGGEVGKPGVLALDRSLNVVEAVFAAGGFLPTADPAAVLVVRRKDPSGYEIIHADLDALLDGDDATGNVALRAFDVVYVPTSPVAEVNKWVDQYIRKNIPVTFTYRLDTINNQ